ncbi:MFS transporter, partial [bacterium]|nr:MFS transporter [bacterium]
MEEAVNLMGIAIAFAMNGIAFFAAIIMFWLINVDSPESESNVDSNPGIISLIREGFSHVFENKTLIYLLFVASVSHFLVEGPLFVGIPVLAHSRFPEGAVAFGIIMSGLGVGMLLGIIGAGTLPKPNPKHLGRLLMMLLSLSGIGLMFVGFMYNTYSVAFTVMIMGAAQGYVVIQYSTWMQIRTPAKLLGRVLSLMMFASVGLVPVSQALCGALIKLSVQWLFLGAGIIMTLINLLVSLSPAVRDMGLEITKD